MPPPELHRHSPSGRHVLMELTGCAFDLLNSVEQVSTILLNSARDGGATVISSHFHPFSPQGLSGVIVIAESHITIHTWPEHGYAAVDVFTCGDSSVAENVSSSIAQKFQASHIKKSSFLRTPMGSLPLTDKTPHTDGHVYA